MQLCCQQTRAFTFLECSKTQEEVAEVLLEQSKGYQSKQKNTLSTGISGVTFFHSHHRLLGILIFQPPPRRPALLLPAEEHIGDIAVAIWTRALF